MNTYIEKRRYWQKCQSSAKEEEVTEYHSWSEERPHSRKKCRIEERGEGEKVIQLPQRTENIAIRQGGEERIVTTKV
jgi:hypothetical protein